MAKAKKSEQVTPYKAGEYCIYVGPRRVKGYTTRSGRKVAPYDRPGHHLCQIRYNDGGYVARVDTVNCPCKSTKTRPRVHAAAKPYAKSSRKKSKR